MTSKERKEGRYQRRKSKRMAIKEAKTKHYDDFDKVFTPEHLYKSYKNCRRNVRWKSSTQKYIANAPEYLYRTYTELQNGTFKSDGFFEFDIFERGKARHIKSVNMKERVVQRCLCDYSLIPMMSRTFIYDNGASMQSKGYSFAAKRFKRHLEWHRRKYGKDGYVLMFDFSNYFGSIPHELLFKALEKQYTDERILHLIKHFINMFGDKGMGLGSQVSQILALVAANELDHFIKEDLHIRCYGRYMDDGYLIHHDKKYLEKCLERIREKCSEIGLTLNLKKTRIIRLNENFVWLKVKYRTMASGKLIKRIWHKSVVRMRRKLKKFAVKVKNGSMSLDDVYRSYQSWKSHTKGLNAYKTIHNMDILYAKLF